jgi:hypothetical protein
MEMKKLDVMNKISKLTEGNPGAMAALCELNTISYSYLEYLENFGIKGTDIYILWNDICDRDTKKTSMLINAAREGILKIDVLKDACSRQDRSGKQLIDFENIINQLPKTDKLIIEIPEEVSNEIKNDLGFDNPGEFVKTFILIFLNIKGLEMLKFSKWINSEKEKINPSKFFSSLMKYAAKILDMAAEKKE